MSAILAAPGSPSPRSAAPSFPAGTARSLDALARFDGTPAAARAAARRCPAPLLDLPAPPPGAEAPDRRPARPEAAFGRRRRFIVHVDIDAFFASVEVLLNPALRGRPVIVGGLPHERGVASTCSYEARRYGVHSGMALRTAAKLCPQGVFVRGNYQLYQSFSERLFAILRQVTPDVEETSIDEAYLDLTRCRHLYPSFSGAARALQARIGRETGLTVSVGVGPNKILAKLATRRAKPAGYFEIPPGGEEDFLRGLPIDSLPGIGPKTQVLLRMLAVQTIGDLWGLPRGSLRSIFGLGGDDIYLHSRGLDPRPIVTASEPKSVSRETTFLEDLWDERLLLAHLAYLCDRLTLALRRSCCYAHVVEVKARTSDFRTEVRRRLLLTPRQDMGDVFRIAEELFLPLLRGTRLALRLVGVKASDLVRGKPLPLFETASDKGERLGAALDQVRDRYGFGSVLTVREKMLDGVYPADPGRGYILKTASLTR